MKVREFHNRVYDYYRQNARDLPWRTPTIQLNPDGTVEDPYLIFISEVMLQQTQVSRVLVKFPEFTSRFPTFETLASASLKDVLSVWQGMGYNRRGKYLRDAAGIVLKGKKYECMISSLRAESAGFSHENEIALSPATPHDETRFTGGEDKTALLQELPGIGPATASAIVTYAFNIPTIFIETNIRTVYLYHFFKDKQKVSDADILPLIESTIDTQNPREWYYALMDYGSWLKKEKKIRNISSKHYVKQSTFEGSRRQIRARVITLLIKHKSLTYSAFKTKIVDVRLPSILRDLQREGMIVKNNTGYALP